MELMEIRKRAIMYCESLTGLTSREIEIAYKAYVTALSNSSINKDDKIEKFINDISNSNVRMSCGSTPSCTSSSNSLNRC